MSRLHVVLASLLLITLTPPAVASHCEDGPAAEPALEVGLPGEALLYLDPAQPGVWQETNGHAGLQKTGGTCIQKNSGRDVPYNADGALLAA